nr:MAG TPA: hypothetical protein [Caudoviricetes sp.]
MGVKSEHYLKIIRVRSSNTNRSVRSVDTIDNHNRLLR